MSAPDSGTGDRRGVVSLPCPVAVDQLLRRVVVQLDKLDLELCAVVDHSGDAGEIGLTMPETKLVIFFGNPSLGTPLMLAHPLIALDLPLKLLIWETDDHHVFLSYNAPSYLADRYGLSEQETEPLRVVETIAQAVISD
jgi:uncharacterized protein (DUF302 family)